MHPVVSLIITLFLLCCDPGTTGAEPAVKTVVVLHSYHQGYEWTNAVNAGIRSSFSPHPGYELAYEYLEDRKSVV